MTSSLKKAGIIGLSTLILAGAGQKTMAASNDKNKEKILNILNEKKNSDIDAPDTYNATEFNNVEKKLLSVPTSPDQVAIYEDKLASFYTKEGFDQKLKEINKDYPDFSKLSESEKQEIIMKNFSDFINKQPEGDHTAAALSFAITVMLLGLYHLRETLNRKTNRT